MSISWLYTRTFSPDPKAISTTVPDNPTVVFACISYICAVPQILLITRGTTWLRYTPMGPLPRVARIALDLVSRSAPP